MWASNVDNNRRTDRLGVPVERRGYLHASHPPTFPQDLCDLSPYACNVHTVGVYPFGPVLGHDDRALEFSSIATLYVSIQRHTSCVSVMVGDHAHGSSGPGRRVVVVYQSIRV